MQFSDFAFPSLWLLAATSIFLLLGKDWRVTTTALGLQYLGVFVLVGLTWPLELAAVKLVSGWLAASVLGMEMVHSRSVKSTENTKVWSGVLFRIFMAILVGMAIISIGPKLANLLLSASYEQILGSAILISMGILHLGITDHPISVVVGILTFFSGFEIIYATIETATFVAGFLAFFTLGVALLGSYLSSAPVLEVDQ